MKKRYNLEIIQLLNINQKCESCLGNMVFAAPLSVFGISAGIRNDLKLSRSSYFVFFLTDMVLTRILTVSKFISNIFCCFPEPLLQQHPPPTLLDSRCVCVYVCVQADRMDHCASPVCVFTEGDDDNNDAAESLDAG